MKSQKNKKKTNKKKTNKKNNKQMQSLNCSPTNNTKNYTCYTDSDLKKMKNVWNARHPDNIITTTNSKNIWEKLKNYYSNVCNKESCWVKQMSSGTKMEKELLNAFAPESPEIWKKNPNEWLSSIDILSVMNQYEKNYKCFEFIGPSPIDYDTHKLNNDCVWEELCHFNLSKLIKNGKKK